MGNDFHIGLLVCHMNVTLLKQEDNQKKAPMKICSSALLLLTTCSPEHDVEQSNQFPERDLLASF